MYESGIGIQYATGEYCPTFNVTRTSTIYVACDPSTEAGELYSVSENQCAYTF